MYYPKSQIITNLSSNGDLEYKSDNTPYSGFYYRLSNGKLFTGKTPQDGPNEELIMPSPEGEISTINDGKVPIYFCKKANELIYIEISKDTFNKLTNQDPNIYWQLYVPFQINWKLTGSREDVFRVNRNIVEIAMNKNKLYKFDDYLKKDYLKFWQ